MDSIRVAVAQLNTVVGDIAGNAEQAAAAIDKARALECEIIALPELCITGYPPEDLLLSDAFIEANLVAVDVLVAKTHGIVAAIGYVDRAEPGSDGSAPSLYNAAAIVADGARVAVHHKWHLPNYGVFDERRYFQPGADCHVVEVAGVQVGFSICEDIWVQPGPADVQCAAGADLVVCLNASPYELGKLDARIELMQAFATRYGAAGVYVNQVGGQDELVFDGASFVIAPDGDLYSLAPQWEESVVAFDVPVLVQPDATRPRAVKADREPAERVGANISATRSDDGPVGADASRPQSVAADRETAGRVATTVSATRSDDGPVESDAHRSRSAGVEHGLAKHVAVSIRASRPSDGLDDAGDQRSQSVGFDHATVKHVATSFKASPSEDKPTLDQPATSRMGFHEDVYSALVTGTRDYVRKTGFANVAVAISGGIDSALVATVAVDALGAAQVVGVTMPSRFSSAGSVSDSELLAANLGIPLWNVPIEPAHAAFDSMLASEFAGTESNTAEENVQARIRGNVMMTIANKFGWLVLTTGNKSEMATGYATLYGDMAGGFAVIKDIPKQLVYELAEHRNAATSDNPPIPQAIIDKPPSAELKPDQTDQDSLPDYAVLDAILAAYVEQRKSPVQIIDALAHMHAGDRETFAQTVQRVTSLVDRNEYKRRQAPPGIKITGLAFGRDRRMPIASAWRG